MLLFCPVCSNTLQLGRGPSTDKHPTGQNKMECRTCPYKYNIAQTFYERKYMKRKAVEDVLDMGAEAWKNADKTDVALVNALSNAITGTLRRGEDLALPPKAGRRPTFETDVGPPNFCGEAYALKFAV